VKHHHRDGSGRHFVQPDDLADRRHGGHSTQHRHHHGKHRAAGVPDPLQRGLQNLALALRLRQHRGPIDAGAAQAIAAALDTAAQAVERT